MGNIPKDQRVPESEVVRVIVEARHERKSVVPTLMEEFGMLEHQAKYHYAKVMKKGLVPTRRTGHAPRIAIMFLNSASEERIELCQACKTPWPCASERFRRRTVAEASQGGDI